MLTIASDKPLVSIAIAVNLLADITGSASGGTSIALQTLGETWLAIGQAAGIAPELLHRVTAIATGGLDVLPYNGAVITLLGICSSKFITPSWSGLSETYLHHPRPAQLGLGRGLYSAAT